MDRTPGTFKSFLENALFASMGGICAVVFSLGIFSNPVEIENKSRVPASETGTSDFYPDCIRISF